jgi:leucyl aminopeptidase
MHNFTASKLQLFPQGICNLYQLTKKHGIMAINIIKSTRLKPKRNHILLVDKYTDLKDKTLEKAEINYLRRHLSDEQKSFAFNRLNHHVFVVVLDKKGELYEQKEAARIAGDALLGQLKSAQISNIQLADYTRKNLGLYFAEGMVLGSYSFDKYKTKKSSHTLQEIALLNKKISEEEIRLMNISNEATCWSRDLMNEPHSTLDAPTLAEEFKKMGKESGAKVEVLSKSKIESLKMGGLLAVNKGSETPPTFTIMEWKPKNAANKKPYIFVGKGVVFDTGGLNIKTGDFMYDMKMDMGGAAAAATALFAVAKAKLPVYAIALIPATDNRPSHNAYAPGDVINMHNGKTVEVINTDAEGRLILADALSYAQKYDPKMVIDLATLTGAAARAIGKYGIVAMKNKAARLQKLDDSSKEVYERLVEFPLWDEYGEQIKSDVADIKNLGGAEGGAITAGKFLEHFTDYPWVHLDIAGPSILASKDSYRSKGGSGVGTRLLFEFMKSLKK